MFSCCTRSFYLRPQGGKSGYLNYTRSYPDLYEIKTIKKIQNPAPWTPLFKIICFKPHRHQQCHNRNDASIPMLDLICSAAMSVSARPRAAGCCRVNVKCQLLYSIKWLLRNAHAQKQSLLQRKSNAFSLFIYLFIYLFCQAICAACVLSPGNLAHN